MRKPQIAFLFVVAFALSAGAALLGTSLQSSSSDWVEVTYSMPLTAMSTEVAFEADIALPDIEEFHVQAKFIDDVDGPAQRLGYVANVTVPSLDITKVPAKYRVERPADAPPLSHPPVEQVIYGATIQFALKDSDGFQLADLESPLESVFSGKANQLQSFASGSVSKELASRTRSIEVRLVLEKCYTCDDE